MQAFRSQPACRCDAEGRHDEESALRCGFYREALALGLDQDDTIVKRRMAQKMGFSPRIVSLAEPNRDELAGSANARAYCGRHLLDTPTFVDYYGGCGAGANVFGRSSRDCSNSRRSGRTRSTGTVGTGVLYPCVPALGGAEVRSEWVAEQRASSSRASKR